MKKILLFLFAICIVGLAALYYFIPAKLDISDSIQINCTIDGGFRTLATEPSWAKWWPGDSKPTGGVEPANIFTYKTDTFFITKISHNNFDISIRHRDSSLSSQMNIFPLPDNAMAVKWHTSFNTSLNPLKRYTSYREAVALKENMQAILTSMQIFLSKKENIYGRPFREESTKDSILLTYKTVSGTYPTTAFVYSIISTLRKMSIDNGAAITGSPMLNITAEASGSYKVMVALPINKELKEKNGYYISRLIPGKFITAEVKGGEATVDETFRNIQFYFQDYKRVTMAIPFQYLVTDRSTEPDTTKWVTKIYAPVY